MVISLKNFLVNMFIAFVICLNVCATHVQEQQIPAYCYDATSFDTPTVTPTVTPIVIPTPAETYTSDTIGCEGYDIKIEKFTDVETGDSYCNVSYVAHEGHSLPENLGFNTSDIDPLEGRYNHLDMDSDHDNQTNGFDLRLPDCGDVPDRLGQASEHDHLQDHLHDSTVDGRRQEVADDQSVQKRNGNSRNTYVAGKRLVRELDLPRGTILNRKNMEHCVLDSDLILKNVNTAEHLVNVLSSPTIQARFRREQYNVAYRTKDRHGMKERELSFFSALQSGKVQSLLRDTKHSDLAKAEAAFAELTNLWPRQRDYSFVIPPHSSNGERQFIERVGVDIMKIAERNLITRPDYIAAHADEQSLKAIQEYKEHCISLQKKGEVVALVAENNQLRLELLKKGIKSSFADAACLALVENARFSPVTQVLGLIKNDLSIEGAHKKLLSFEGQIFKQAQSKNMYQLRDWTVKQYGFDAIEAARRCYVSRPDYDHTAQNYVIVSEALTVMLNIIENKDLHVAHKELVHLEKQLDDAYASLDLTDAAAQKERLIKSFGIDALVVAHDKYKNRSDYKNLVENFIPINVQQTTAHILENNDNQLAVAHELGKVSDQVFSNARHCKFTFVAEVESHVDNSIETIRTTNDRHVFILHAAMVDRVLGDMQAQVDAMVAGKPTFFERSPELFVRAIGKFFERLNPLVQAQELGGLAKDAARGAWRVAVHTIIHPLATAEKVSTVTQQGIAFLRSTADFVSDITVGRLYLPEAEYQQRIDAFKNGINAIPVDQLKQLTAENWVDLGAHVAADFVFCKGFSSAFIYLKEIDAMSKVQQQAAKVARTFKKAVDTHLADNPILVTAEGVVLKMSKKGKDVGGAAKNVIGSSKALLESAWAKGAIKFEEELEAIRIAYYKKLDGFGVFAHKPVKIDYKHILGIDIKWAETGEALKLNGFHHNLNNSLGKSGALKIVKKSTNGHGCYVADVMIGNAEFRGKTFFPDHWSRDDVIKKIHEACENFKKSGVEPSLNNKGKYKITGFTSEGIEIEMCFTVKGEMKTAYPIFR